MSGILDEQDARWDALRTYVTEAGGDASGLWSRVEAATRAAHEGQFRTGGRPYISHVLDVGEHLVQWGVAPEVVLAGLLHDAVRYGQLTSVEEVVERVQDDDLGRLFRVVNRLPRYDSLVHYTRDNARLHNVFDQMVNEVRAVLVRCANRLADLEAPEDFRGESREALVLNSHEVYLPLLERLGMWEVRCAFEDRLFALRAAERYALVERWQATERRRREEQITLWRLRLRTFLSQAGLDGVKIRLDWLGPAMSFRHAAFGHAHEAADVSKYDARHLFKTEILTTSVEDAYRALAAVHQTGTPANNLFHDYLAQPKPNGYAAIHTGVLYDGELFPVYLRTGRLDGLARRGILLPAAYQRWFATDPPQGWQPVEQRALERLITSLRQSRAGRLEVFTPNGDLVLLEEGATVLDFAYAIHSDLGRQAGSALVNGQPRPLHAPVHAGDVIEIYKDLGRRWPDPERLDWVQSSRARTNMQQQLNKRPEAKGRRLVEAELSARGRRLEDYLTRLATLADEIGATREELFIGVAQRDFTAHEIADRLIYVDPARRSVQHEIEATEATLERVPQFRSEHVLAAPCCSPSPGEEIAGYLVQRGIELHLRGCPRLMNQERVLPLRWRSRSVQARPVQFVVRARNRRGLINDLTTLLRGADVDIRHLVGKRVGLEGEMDEVHVTLDVANRRELEFLVDSIRAIPSVSGLNVDGEEADAALSDLRRYPLPPRPVPMHFSPGKPVWGEGRFWGRDRELERIVTLLSGDFPPALLVRGPRRIGKTSLLRHLRVSRGIRERFTCVYMDLQAARDRPMADLLRLLAIRLRREVDGKNRLHLPSAAQFRESPAEQFLAFLDDLSDAYPRANKGILVALDEVGTLFEGIQNGTVEPAIMTMLRSIIQHDRRLTLLLCTSDDVAALMEEEGVFELLNVTQDVRLGHLEEEAARRLIQNPLRGEVNFEAPAIARLIDVTDRHPFYLQILGANLITQLNADGRRVVYERDITQLVNRHTSYLNGSEFKHLWQDSEGERRVLRALCAWPPADARSPFRAAYVCQRLDQAGIAMDGDRVGRILERLARRQTLIPVSHEGTVQYHVRVELFQRWFATNYPLHRAGGRPRRAQRRRPGRPREPRSPVDNHEGSATE